MHIVKIQIEPDDFTKIDENPYLKTKIATKITNIIDEFGDYEIDDLNDKISFRYYNEDDTNWGKPNENYTFAFSELIPNKRWNMILLAKRMAELDKIRLEQTYIDYTTFVIDPSMKAPLPAYMIVELPISKKETK